VEALLESRLESTLNPGAGEAPRSALESARDPALAEAHEPPRLHEFGDLRRDEVPFELDRVLARLPREEDEERWIGHASGRLPTEGEGVHAGLLRCVGRAPDGLRWEMGIRPGVTPRLAYRSGDIRVSAMSPF
jgi:hypothetical protein